MKMLFKATLLASALAAFVSAQTVSTHAGSSVAPSSTVSQVMPPAATQGFMISNTTMSDRSQWCLAQTNTCPQICGGVSSQNSCNSTTLSYTCVCQNGTVPDCTAFMQTVPYYICLANFGQCINEHPNDQVGQGVCTSNEQCGTRNATAEYLAQVRSTASTTSSTASQTSSGSSSTAAGSSSASASATGKSDASMTTYTTGAFAMVLMAAFKLLL